MYLLISIIHIIVCLVLIFSILLQAGRGGGLSEMFGGGMTQNEKLFGAETNKFMKMVTSYAAIIFVITCILLGILTANKGRSLVAGRRIQPVMNSDALIPVVPATGSSAPAATLPQASAAPVAPVAPAPSATSVSTTVGTAATTATAAPAATAAVAAPAPAAPAKETAPAAAQ